MTRLAYLANVRLPTEKAHGYQIMQMCAAFAEAGTTVRLMHADRRNSPELAGIEDVWGYYDVARTFEREKVPCLDWYPALRRLPGGVARLAERWVAALQLTSYTLALAAQVSAASADVFYSRDSVPLAALVVLRPRLRARLYYEAHEFPASRLGRLLRRWLVRWVAGVIVITRQLERLYADELDVPLERLCVAPDGVRLERFEGIPDRGGCRAALGLPQDAFVVGYVGQLHLMGMAKGVDTLVEASVCLTGDAHSRPLRLCIVGGPDKMLGQMREQAAARGLPGVALVTPGQVRPHDVPLWMRAFDVCALPSPWNPFFAYYTSPLKLFEYMASGTPIVASNLPSFTEILSDGKSALLVPPGDAAVLADSLRRLRDNPALGDVLAGQARQDVAQYTWQARAEALLAFAGELAA